MADLYIQTGITAGQANNLNSTFTTAASINAVNAARSTGAQVFYQPDAVVNQTNISYSGFRGNISANIDSVTVSRPTKITRTDVLNTYTNTYNNVYSNGALTSSTSTSTMSTSSATTVLFNTEPLIAAANQGIQSSIYGYVNRIPLSGITKNTINVNAGFYQNTTYTTNKTYNTTNNTYNNTVNQTVYRPAYVAPVVRFNTLGGDMGWRIRNGWY